jgi:hypothetical protein
MADHGGYAVIPDESPCPSAVFREIEQAIQWGLATFGSDRFQIRWVLFVDPGAESTPRGN